MSVKKSPSIVFPAPQPELAAAIAELQAAVATLGHVKQAVAGWPARIAQTETELADVERRLDHAETDRDLASSDTSGIQATIKELSAEVAEKREALNRLLSRRPHLNERGEAANAKLEEAKSKIRSERSTYFDAVRDAIAGPFAESAAILAQHAAQYRALVHAAGFEMTTDWLGRACVPDIRQTSRDLLSDDATGALAAAVAAMGPTLEPLRTAGPLLMTSRFDPRTPIASRTKEQR